MIITCPRCSTRYVIDPAVLVPNGRAVGCSNCGHHWTQAPPAPPAPSAPPEEGGEAPPLPDSPPGSPADGEADAEIGPAAEPGGESEPQTPEMEVSTADTPDSAALEPAGAPAPLAEWDDRTSDWEPTGPEKEEEQEAPADSNETPPAAAEPEPIPAALREGRSPAERGRQNQKKKPSVAMLAGLGALAALIVIVVVLAAARGPIVSAIPGAAGLYRGVGLLGDELGAGLEIRDVRSARRRDGADEVLTIEGIVANVTDEPLELPMVRVSLSDADGEELQFVTVPPDMPTLPPGETVSFEARISNPSAIVRRVKVKFAPPNGSSPGHDR